MSLSAEQFGEILSRIDADSCEAVLPGHEKRRAPRVATATRATIVTMSAGVDSKPVGVELRDFSSRGIRFLFPTTIKCGEQFVLKLSQKNGTPAQILCTVVHALPTREGHCTIGAEFTCVLQSTKTPRASVSERERIQRSILD